MLKPFAKIDSELSRLIDTASPVADEILILCGAAPDCQDTFNNLMETFVKDSAPIRADSVLLARDEKRVAEFLDRFEFAEIDPVRCALVTISACQRESAYALGVAVGLRLAGGAR